MSNSAKPRSSKIADLLLTSTGPDGPVFILAGFFGWFYFGRVYFGWANFSATFSVAVDFSTIYFVAGCHGLCPIG
jgi:hypothetical protein